MWNETRNQTPVAGAGVTLESPFVGAADVLKPHQARASKKFTLRERPFLDLVNVRGEPGDAAFVAAFERVVGCQPPSAPNTVARGVGYDVLWLGPDEYLLLGPVADTQILAAGLAAALTGIAHSLVDVSQRQIALQVSGPYASAILNSGCPLDLDAAEFPPGMCTRT
ncbi:MAG: sarcosine oxidase subunit gamma, partial [Burkholderia vietnamiensis]|nr:sarcosine oxidase subunit gamma [Burkholderia vietnamiensis]